MARSIPGSDPDPFADFDRLVAAEMAGGDDLVATAQFVAVVDRQYATLHGFADSSSPQWNHEGAARGRSLARDVYGGASHEQRSRGR
jgi:hypothetical protein